MITKQGIPLAIAHSVNPDNVKSVRKMCKLAYELGASTIILGEVTPSGRSATSLELLLNPDIKNEFYAEVDDLFNEYRGKMDVQRSANTMNQLKRYRALPNAGGIIRPNGDIRLDCMAPFILGNVLSDDFFEVWKNKSQECWSRPEVDEYINGFTEGSSVNKVYTNYSGNDILLDW